MPLAGYGLLIGKITASRPQRRGNPHWLLLVQSGNLDHPAYRVAVNLQTTEGRKAPELQYQVADFKRSTPAASKLMKALTALAPTPYFLSSHSTPNLPHLDFVRGGFIDPNKFKDLPARSRDLQTRFKEAVAEARKSGAMVAVFGTGYPIDTDKNRSVPTGFTGIENLHMNQGARNLIRGEPHYRENTAGQDGGIIFLLDSGTKGFFVKFRSQTTVTDLDGNPADTGIKELDKTPDDVRRAIMPGWRKVRSMAARRTAVRSVSAPLAGPKPPPGKQNPVAAPNNKGFMFADFNPDDSSGKFVPDNDDGTYKTPYVVDRSKLKIRGPVPAPHAYPTMDLASVVGANPPGYVANSSGKSIAFDIIGDSGATSERNLGAFETKVTDLLSHNAASSPPAFLYHVGDVVYFYGEQNFYYGQFYEPFKAYPAPIFAIPGNHDAITYNDKMVSLDTFQQAFCAEKPGTRWQGAGAIMRSSMTQPGVFFTLNAPLVSIIGLYSNWGESLGWCDEQQLLFLYNELVRLKKLRSGGLPAVILAIHHFPRWIPGEKDPNSTAIDNACEKASFWPDAVICGHAHLYQRIVRQNTGQSGKADIPYIVTGAGGHVVSPGQEVGKPYMAKLDTRIGKVMFESGYVRANVTSPASGDPVLSFEYHSVKPAGRGPDDLCQLNLKTNKLI
jgi:uncharacterized protein YukJ